MGGGHWGGMGGKVATGGLKKVVPSLGHSELESSVRPTPAHPDNI